MKNLKVWSGLAMIFISGVVLGAIVSSIIIRHNVRGFIGRGPQGAQVRIVMETIRGMELDDRQREEIDRIMEKYRPDMQEISSEFGDRMEEVSEKQFADIKSVLSDEQKDIFEERAQQLRERFKNLRHGRRDGRRRDREIIPPPPPKDAGQ